MAVPRVVLQAAARLVVDLRVVHRPAAVHRRAVVRQVVAVRLPAVLWAARLEARPDRRALKLAAPLGGKADPMVRMDRRARPAAARVLAVQAAAGIRVPVVPQVAARSSPAVALKAAAVAAAAR